VVHHDTRRAGASAVQLACGSPAVIGPNP